MFPYADTKKPEGNSAGQCGDSLMIGVREVFEMLANANTEEDYERVTKALGELDQRPAATPKTTLEDKSGEVTIGCDRIQVARTPHLSA